MVPSEDAASPTFNNIEEAEELPVIQKPKLSVLQPEAAQSTLEGNFLTSGMQSMKHMVDRFSVSKTPKAGPSRQIEESLVTPVDVKAGLLPNFNQFLDNMPGVPPQLTSMLAKDDPPKINEEDEEQSAAAYSQEVFSRQEKEIVRLRLSVEKLTKQLGSAASPSRD